MKIAFVVNNILTEQPGYTTALLAKKLHDRNHKVYFINVDDLLYNSEGHMGAYAVSAPAKSFKTTETYLNALQNCDHEIEKIEAKDLDILMLRNDPSVEDNSRSWASNAGLVFGQIALNDGVVVLNDPHTLSHAANKMYFQHFPEIIRPKTIISRNVNEIKDFFEENGQSIILKPLQGSGGKGVFKVTKDTIQNFNQIAEAISRDGYIIAQEYMSDAESGDIRLFVMNGLPLKINGKYAAIKRKAANGDLRNNIHSGGKASKIKVTNEMLDIVDIIRPKLIKDGMFLVGLDIVGNKLLEINVFTPGGLTKANEIYQVDFSQEVIDSLERKIMYKGLYHDNLDNLTLATLN